MSSNKLTNIFLQAMLAVSVCLHLSGCATDDVKADDENSTAMAADLDKSPSDGDVNPDLAKDTLAEDPTKGDDLGIDDASPTASDALNKDAATPAPDSQKIGEGDVSAATTAPPTGTEKPVVPEVSEAPANPFSQDVEITNVKYNSEKNGGTLSIETSAPATFRKREGANPNQIVVEVANAKIPARLLRPLVTKDFRQAIASVYVYQDKASSTARFVIQMRDHSTANVQQDGKTISVASQVSGADSVSGSQAQEESGEAGFKTFSGAGPTDPKKQQANESALKFYGKPINIEVRDMPVVDVLNFISEQSGANLLVNNDVKGQITLKLKQVPWDQALLLVMKSQQLGYVREGSVLRIAPLDSLKAESDKAAKVLESQKDAEPLKVKIIPVSYAKVDELTVQLTSFLTKRGKAVADKRTSSVIITDIVENLERASNLVHALDTPPFQVLIEGKVVEASQQFTSNMGVNWNINPSIQTGAQTLSPALNIVTQPTQGSTGALMNLTYGTFDALGTLQAQLQLSESEQLVRVVSSPRIVTVNNEKAEIRQTIQIPVATTTVTTAGVAPTVSYSFKPVELALTVTPQITAESDVLMQINLKREFQNGVAQGAVPLAINSREATTKVMVRNGQTAVIGGIYQSDNTIDETGVPYLRSLPVVGWLFKNRARQDSKNELLLFLTPRILNSEQLAKTGESL